MARTLDDMIAGLPADRQREVETQAARLIEEETTLRDLRKAHALTQVSIAQSLHISQDGVSRIENRSDLLLSTLRSYVESMGGKLRLVVEFPDRKPVTLADFDSLTAEGKRAPRQRKATGEGASV
jgi:transcriptional regulator with XRE-family HTH domain